MSAQNAAVTATWQLMLGYVRSHRWALLAGALLSLATTATGLALPLAAEPGPVL